MQNFKMSASEYLRCTPKYTISRLNNQNFSGPRRGGDTPSPHPTPRHLASRAFGARPPLKNPGYAPGTLVTVVKHTTRQTAFIIISRVCVCVCVYPWQPVTSRASI